MAFFTTKMTDCGFLPSIIWLGRGLGIRRRSLSKLHLLGLWLCHIDLRGFLKTAIEFPIDVGSYLESLIYRGLGGHSKECGDLSL